MLKIIITSDNLHLPLFHDMMVVDLVHLMNHIMLCIYIIIIKTSILSQSCLVRMKFLIYLFLFISLKYFQIKKLGILIDNVNIYRQSILTKFEFFLTLKRSKQWSTSKTNILSLVTQVTTHQDKINSWLFTDFSLTTKDDHYDGFYGMKS